MLNLKHYIALGAFVSAAGAWAQETPPGNSTVGPPQLRDFRLPGERRTAPVPPPSQEPTIQQPRTQTPPAPVPAPAPAPREAQPQPQTPPAAGPVPERRPGRPGPANAPQRPRAEPPVPAQAPGPAPVQPDTAPPAALPQQPVPGSAPLPAPAPEAQREAPPPGQGYPRLLYLVPVGLALAAVLAWRRRRAAARQTMVESEPVAATAPPRPAPMPRPWIELEFRPERASATLTEASVQFELVVRNTGGSAARNIRIEARMFNAGREQDKEIGAFFRRPAAEVTKSTLPSLDATSETSFRSVVTMAREAMRAVNVQGRTLFVPMVAFNVFYEWNENRRGQTSRSYVVGREPEQPAERMAPFRLDLGPRIYRTVGQREHSLARRV